MITAQESRESKYDKTIKWCEKHIQSAIREAKEKNETRANVLFGSHEAEPEELRKYLEKRGFEVEIQNLSKMSGIYSAYYTAYNIIVNW